MAWNKTAERKIDHTCSVTRYKTTPHGMMLLSSYSMMYTAAAIISVATAAATAALRIMHRRPLGRTSIKSVSRASPIDISRLPDTGLIRGHIISAETSVEKRLKRQLRRRMERANNEERVMFMSMAFSATSLGAVQPLFNYEWKPTVV